MLSQVQPTNWPRHVRFIDSTCYHASVSPAIKQQIQALPSTAKSSNSKRPKVVIRPISNQSHPAYGQFGLFAGQRIAAKSQIIDYIGEVHCDDRPNSDYDLSLCRLPEGVSIGVDASAMGNPARFVNDFRGIAIKPNALFIDTRTASGEIRISIWSSNRDIKKGEEILVSYGKTWWRSRAHLT
ncbi:hypothetical protein BYT27DRAFT_7189343 [Phlegmacium glaucopus]|nr:hypothetical protein BYT27DRAFT_7189343 [Phlegmacium glaucopus]